MKKILWWILGILIVLLIVVSVLVFMFTYEDPVSHLDSPNCAEDVYNCGDFGTQAEAQEVFDYCMNVGQGDIHGLDSDGDGVVCEGLP